METYPSVPIPGFPIKEKIFYDTLITSLVGAEKRRSRHTTVTRYWTLNYHAIHDGDCGYLWDFFNARKGKYESFTFIHPESEVSYTARFVDDILKRKEIGLNLFDVGIELVEVI